MSRMYLSDYREPGVTPTPDAAGDFRMLEHSIADRSGQRKSFKGSMDALHAAVQSLCPGIIYMLDTLSFGDGDGAVVLSIQGERVKQMRQIFPNLIVYGLSHEGYLALGGREEEDVIAPQTQEQEDPTISQKTQEQEVVDTSKKNPAPMAA